MSKSDASLLVLGLACLAPAALAQASPGLGETKLLPGDVAVGLAGGVQQFPVIAGGAGSYLAVWEDHRAVPSLLTTGEGTRDLYARRIAPDGQPIDALPFRVSDAPGRKEDVRIAFDGTTWLVAWENVVPTQFSQSMALLGVRVAADGSVLDDPPITIRGFTSSSSLEYALAGDPLGWVVVVQGSNASEAGVEGHRIAPDGTVTPGGSGNLLSSTSLWTHMDLESNGQILLLAASSGGIVKGRRLSSALAPLGGELSIAGGSSENPTVGSDGAGFVVAWESSFNGYVVRSRAVPASGTLGIVRMVAGTLEDCYDPSIVWSGAEYVLAFSADRFVFPGGLTKGLRVARLGADGAPLDGEGQIVGQGAEPRDPDVASLGAGEAQLVWRDAATQPPHAGDVLGTRVTALGFETEVALSTSTPRQTAQDLAAGGAGHLAVLASERNGAVAILAQRLDPFGTALDPEPIELASGPALGAPRVAWNGSSFLVVWQDEIEVAAVLGAGSPTDDQVFGRRVAPDGTLLDPAPFHVLDGATPDLAAVGEEFLVAARFAMTTQIFHIRGVRVDGAGQLVAGSEMMLGGNFARYPSVAAFDDRWIVSWQRNPTHDDPAESVFARVVQADGTMMPQVFVDGGPRPSVAASGDVALVTWGVSDVLGRLVADDGTLLGGSFVLGTAAGDQRAPSAAWDGATFVVAWEDARNATSRVDERRDVFAARVSEAGALLDGPGGFAVATSPEDERTPVAGGRAGDPLFAFARYVPEPQHATVRTALVRASEWTSLGGGLAGVLGVPVLEGDGALVAGSAVHLALAGAAPSRIGAHVLGLTRVDLPFGGGTIVPSLDVLVPFATGADGRALTSVPVPPSFPSGLQLWAQSWLLDAAAPRRYAASNALTQVAP